MKQEEGSEKIYIRRKSKRKEQYTICWGFEKKENSDNYLYMEHTFNHLPTASEIRAFIETAIDTQTTADIESGFIWRGVPVWLSIEKQHNYTSNYIHAKQTGGANLPITFKFGTDEAPMYVTFETVDELEKFHGEMLAHVQRMQEAGWEKKKSINYKNYEYEENCKMAQRE